jgi:secondary thiamine-phosphate synthase enzyme
MPKSVSIELAEVAEERMIRQESLTIQTRGRGSYDITREVQRLVTASEVTTGICHVFIHHTSASLILCENADPDVRHDLEDWLARAVPDGDTHYRHGMEGPDDMPAHIRSILTNMDLTLPVSSGRCALGTWQGVFLYEHRHHGQRRRIVVTVN